MFGEKISTLTREQLMDLSGGGGATETITEILISTTNIITHHQLTIKAITFTRP